MPQSAFIVHVPQAEACVADLRERFDASSGLGVPAHITVLVPFMSPELITAEVLARAQAALGKLRPFVFLLSSRRGRLNMTISSRSSCYQISSSLRILFVT